MLQSRRLGRNQQLQRASQNAPALAYGSQGSGVAELQDVLADLGESLSTSSAGGSFDGIFGGETRHAVLLFQQRHGLAPDGVAGRQTMSMLDALVLADPHLELPDPEKVAAEDSAVEGQPPHLRPRAAW